MAKPFSIPSRLLQTLQVLLLLAATLFLALHFRHLTADSPNHSPWMDWSKYTDEGWYGDAAIRHYQRGHWYVPGDFNPAAALPLWPLLEAALFHFTGVSLTAARALTVSVFAGILLTAYLLLRRWQTLTLPATETPSPTTPGSKPQARHTRPITLAPAVAVLLLAVSPFCYVFTRLAILEPLLILLTLLALLTASHTQPPASNTARPWHLLPTNNYQLPTVFLGLLIPAMVLTKTTAFFLLPAIAYLLYARAGYRIRPFLRLAIPSLVIAAVVWLAYYGLLVRPHFLLDYRYLFSANAYTGMTPSTALTILGATLADGMWFGPLLYPLSLLAALVALVEVRLLRNPLIPALLLWAAGYIAFLAYHDNLQPRYYLVIAIPLTLLVPVVFESYWYLPRLSHQNPNSPRLLAPAAIVLALIAVLFMDSRHTLYFVRHPEYTFTTAAANIHRVIAADPTHNPLVLSISGSDLSLMTGLPSICDDFGTLKLSDRIALYHPGWYLTWNWVDDDKMDALTPLYHLQRVAEFPAMDDPERNLLILYRLEPIGNDPATPTQPQPPSRPRRPIPRTLQTKLGQQPSPTQLEH